MRVGILVEQALAPVPGGTGRYSVELAAALARTAGPGDTVSGWTAWHRDLSAVSPRPRRLPLPRRVLAELWARGTGPAPRGVDVVHAPTLLLPPARRGVPLVVTIHDAVPWTHGETLTPRGVRWHRAMGERAVRDAAAVAVPTRYVGDRLLEVLPGLAPERVHVLGAGVAGALREELPDADQAAIARRYALPDRYLLSLATLEPRKGLDVLLAALDSLGPDAPALLVAGQPGWGDVRLPSRDGVRALGKVPDGDLGVVLRRAAALVVPSREEGFGLPVAEAMAVGTPVICSDAPALVEVSGGAAVVVPRGDSAALAAAIRGLDDATATRLAAAGRARAAAFDWDEVGRRAWDLYRSVTE